MFIEWLTQETLKELYDQHGIFIFPSFTEGFGKVFLEAMARGLCVVASDTGGMRDVIRSGENGWRVPTGDVDGFCRAVGEALRPGCAERVSRAAAVEARRYSWKRTAQETVDFYARLMALRNGGAGV